MTEWYHFSICKQTNGCLHWTLTTTAVGEKEQLDTSWWKNSPSLHFLLKKKKKEPDRLRGNTEMWGTCSSTPWGCHQQTSLGKPHNSNPVSTIHKMQAEPLDWQRWRIHDKEAQVWVSCRPWLKQVNHKRKKIVTFMSQLEIWMWLNIWFFQELFFIV